MSEYYTVKVKGTTLITESTNFDAENENITTENNSPEEQ